MMAAAAGQPKILLEDSLTGGKTKLAKHVIGGEFTKDGWLAKEGLDNLYYELPEGTTTASIEFEIKGQVLNAPRDARKHVVIVSDRYLGPGADYNSKNSTVHMLRVWSIDRGPSKAGKIRLRTIGPGFGETESKFQKDSQPLEWDPNTWYKLRVSWDGKKTSFDRDGLTITTIDYPDKKVQFRHILLNTGSYANGLKGLIGVTYRNLKVYAQ